MPGLSGWYTSRILLWTLRSFTSSRPSLPACRSPRSCRRVAARCDHTSLPLDSIHLERICQNYCCPTLSVDHISQRPSADLAVEYGLACAYGNLGDRRGPLSFPGWPFRPPRTSRPGSIKAGQHQNAWASMGIPRLRFHCLNARLESSGLQLTCVALGLLRHALSPRTHRLPSGDTCSC